MLDEQRQLEGREITAWPAFGLDASVKRELLLGELSRLTRWHRSACVAYDTILRKLAVEDGEFESLVNVPYLPVRLFKLQDLISVSKEDVIKVMTSSGTSGQAPSRIHLDRETATLQVKILSHVVSDFLGSKRMPMLIIDCKSTVRDRERFSARTAGIQGFSIFSRGTEFALNDDMSIDFDRVDAFLDAHAGTNILLFGFTFIVWKYFLEALEATGRKLPLEGSVLIHGGGWKKLVDQAVGRDEFGDRVAAATGLTRIHNYYGMVEQTGSIFMECEYGHLHSSSWSEIIIRDPIDFSPLPIGHSGLLQLCSIIPKSYPGHSLLSEDIGRVLGEDDCACGRKGTYFAVDGRLEAAEVRGCSDTAS